jgi:hypothetical protein
MDLVEIFSATLRRSVTRCGNFITTVVIFRHFSSFLDDCGNLKFLVITTVIFSRSKISRPKFYRFCWKKTVFRPCSNRNLSVKIFLNFNLTGGCAEKIFARKNFLPSVHVTHFDFTTLTGLHLLLTSLQFWNQHFWPTMN